MEVIGKEPTTAAKVPVVLPSVRIVLPLIPSSPIHKRKRDPVPSIDLTSNGEGDHQEDDEEEDGGEDEEYEEEDDGRDVHDSEDEIDEVEEEDAEGEDEEAEERERIAKAEERSRKHGAKADTKDGIEWLEPIGSAQKVNPANKGEAARLGKRTEWRQYYEGFRKLESGEGTALSHTVPPDVGLGFWSLRGSDILPFLIFHSLRVGQSSTWETT
jgi:hypothetical protein